ncbi:alpha/beta hydrolase [Croceivirga lutea]|uniref:alpha/beta fold hydrolase n=1 Tax=Croceivirga lutea TaxID=1775167 RepID=UPI00163A04C9|nr:alpha/beta hydrolase [Croceivirga lutea]GGG45103.1 alpha/beta hydrolase [Croceivirga lutea]
MKTYFVFVTLLVTIALQSQKTPQPIHVSVSGEGNANSILFIPGFTVPGESWEATVKQLEKSYECHVVTLAGFGGEAPIGFPWLPKVNDALNTYIHENQLTNLTVIGHSLGGTIATWLASRENNTISKLILIDALPAAGDLMFPNFNPEDLAYDSPFNQQQLAMSSTQFEQMAGGMALGMSSHKEAQQKIKEWMLAADRETYVYGYTDYLKLDMRADLNKISIPVTILAADKPFGKEMVQQTYSKQYQNLENYELRIAENSAHFVMFDQPEWFSTQLLELLATN